MNLYSADTVPYIAWTSIWNCHTCKAENISGWCRSECHPPGFGFDSFAQIWKSMWFGPTCCDSVAHGSQLLIQKQKLNCVAAWVNLGCWIATVTMFCLQSHTYIDPILMVHGYDHLQQRADVWRLILRFTCSCRHCSVLKCTGRVRYINVCMYLCILTSITSPLNKCPTCMTSVYRCTLKVWHPPWSGASKPNFSGRTVLTKNPPLFDASDVDGEDDGDQDDDHGHCVMVVIIVLSFLWFPMITGLETAGSQCRVGFSWHLNMLWM